MGSFEKKYGAKTKVFINLNWVAAFLEDLGSLNESFSTNGPPQKFDRK